MTTSLISHRSAFYMMMRPVMMHDHNSERRAVVSIFDTATPPRPARPGWG